MANERTADLSPVHPGEILTEEYLEPLGWTPYRLAKELGVAYTRVEAILKGRRAVSAETAHRLGRLFNTEPRFWLNLQASYDLRVALTDELRAELGRITPLPATEITDSDLVAA